ncbi:hypothetical protein EYF80_006161 [Liparis tanakae]|uniref:Uncharacterized protein n=1 Tax=Liparis tanakae TaxID=230148 RepID=A0A4Z2J2D7_9TELE|nr:hypothetical protein EYF80_006161 [Liparis tanakae]
MGTERMHRGHHTEPMLDGVVSENRSEVSGSVQLCKIKTLDMSQRKCSAELNTEAGERGKACVETWISPPSVPSSCWPRYTLWVFVLRLLHTLPVWPAEGCFKGCGHALANHSPGVGSYEPMRAQSDKVDEG